MPFYATNSCLHDKFLSTDGINVKPCRVRYPKGSCAFTRREINKKLKWVYLTRSKTGTHTVAYHCGNGSDKNGTDKLSFTRRDLSDPFHFYPVRFTFSCSVNRLLHTRSNYWPVNS